MANDHLLWKQVLSRRGICAHALQGIMFARVYGPVFEYPVFDSQSTPSNTPLPLGKSRGEPDFPQGLGTTLGTLEHSMQDRMISP
jgi:hypothetical protein